MFDHKTFEKEMNPADRLLLDQVASEAESKSSMRSLHAQWAALVYPRWKLDDEKLGGEAGVAELDAAIEDIQNRICGAPVETVEDIAVLLDIILEREAPHLVNGAGDADSGLALTVRLIDRLMHLVPGFKFPGARIGIFARDWRRLFGADTAPAFELTEKARRRPRVAAKGVGNSDILSSPLSASLTALVDAEKAALAAGGAAASAVAAWIDAWVPDPDNRAETAAVIRLLEEQRKICAAVLPGRRATRARPSAEPEILRLFREWQEKYARFNAFCEHQDDAAFDELELLDRQIFDAPAGDARGLAVKAFMTAFYERGGARDNPPSLGGLDPAYHYGAGGMLGLSDHALKGLIASAVEFLPELAPRCAALLASPTQLEDEDEDDA